MVLTCRSAQFGELRALVLEGDLDLASVPTLHNALARLLLQERGRTVAVDLDGLDVLDDAGTGVLLGAAGRAREAGGDLVLVCTTPRLLERFTLSGLARAIEVRDRLSG
ncbi:MAG: anti-sigma factor antagonist [Acidimicrobiales bacterium]